MNWEFIKKITPVIVVPLLLLLIPPPSGLQPLAWQLFAIYVGAILGLVFQPFSEPVIMLSAVGICGVCLNSTKLVLSGYSDLTTWLVFSAVLISIAFIETGLGKRIAFYLIRLLGRTSLGLGYAGAILDYILAPGIPSNTARTAGITFPILRSIAVALGSTPGPSARRIGSYLAFLTYAATSTTSYSFLTAFAPTLLLIKLGAEILNLQLDWMTWFIAALVPTGIMMLVTPWLLYKVYPPEIKTLDNKKVAREGLAEMGAMTLAEKKLICLFILAIIGWMFGSALKLNATAVAIAIIALCLVLRVISWDNIAGNKGAWTTLAWYGGIIGLANSLSQSGFFIWLSDYFKQHIDLHSYSSLTVISVLLILSIVVRYMFASGAAYILSMAPVFLTIGLAANVPTMPLLLSLSFSLSYGSLLTHYGSGPGPVIFSAGYVPQKTWWAIGTLLMLVHLFVNTVIAFPYWSLLGLWH
jgi:DASS family divalent anion:Na+ symporter